MKKKLSPNIFVARYFEASWENQSWTTHLEENHLHSNTQHGFRASLPTNSALLTQWNKLYKNINTKHVSLIMLCDLEKAFDSINHDMLLGELYMLKLTRSGSTVIWTKEHSPSESGSTFHINSKCRMEFHRDQYLTQFHFWFTWMTSHKIPLTAFLSNTLTMHSSSTLKV